MGHVGTCEKVADMSVMLRRKTGTGRSAASAVLSFCLAMHRQVVLCQCYRRYQIPQAMAANPGRRWHRDRLEELLQNDQLHHPVVAVSRLQLARRRVSQLLPQHKQASSGPGRSAWNRRWWSSEVQPVWSSTACLRYGKHTREAASRLSAARCTFPASSSNSRMPHSSSGHLHAAAVASKMSRNAWGSSSSVIRCTETAADVSSPALTRSASDCSI
ncbi:uncharacterized protein LOC133536310 [Nerophis ophidion]|uniref:uncharacterized protein LOC133536310 n=1 Tax=Nerophis ophidion TaxID=159077 RepID=UPI002ADF3E45|nr:uncharacterized protein LOC133536310 [Nerophis ophidion]